MAYNMYHSITEIKGEGTSGNFRTLTNMECLSHEIAPQAPKGSGHFSSLDVTTVAY